jgi:hypothetical protein
MKLAIIALFFLVTSNSYAAFSEVGEVGRTAIQKMAGCYLIDYSYTETESLKAGYVRDNRVYDVNKNKSVKELIYTIESSPTKIRLQHILFATDLDGKFMEGSELRHQAEDWEFESEYLYDFVAPATWEVRATQAGSWTRRITNLDDGLRYQCSAPWLTTTANPEWTCSNYAPIPGRETRDMGRKDYNTLQRTTRIINYGTSWLERQNNIKTIHDADNTKTPLAKEEGKNWYVRLPDSECDVVRPFVKQHTPFWALMQETWSEILDGETNFKEKVMQPNRYVKVMELEAKYLDQDLGIQQVREQAKKELIDIIEMYRVR